MSELREELARRLATVIEGNDSGAVRNRMWLELADECIRQMEWARKEMKAESHRLIQGRRDGTHEWVSISDVIYVHDVCHNCPITLAPDNWKQPQQEGP